MRPFQHRILGNVVFLILKLYLCGIIFYGLNNETDCIVYSFKSVAIVTECINDHNDTNKRNNCLNLISALNVYLNDEH